MSREALTNSLELKMLRERLVELFLEPVFNDAEHIRILKRLRELLAEMGVK